MADPEKIGKYQILGRIGRGGMGTIFKAHDPVLNRPVALKVISTEVEVTDEIRARFFREAQACARLSHPNIVTVYDMGEDDGRLFIVMELLEGVELRRLIADRTPLAIEDKLSILGQVCSGLYYAHQRGIVHRDIKPANIILLPNDQVKILDFGIAHIENLQGTLTRTGLIMGTLRYMAPEQLRGRADQRTDIFSVGAVCYEFLCLQPPYSGKDTLHLLEQLRAEDPIPLHLVDPTIPLELSDIVARAMRKDPQERFADLKQMRMQVEHVHRTLAEEAARVNTRVLAQRDQLRQLQAELADRVGRADEETPITMDEPPRLAALQTLEVDLAARIRAAQGMLMRAEALAPAFECGRELLQAGQFAEAIGEFEAIVADMPEHARAADGLARAREGADAERRGQLAGKLVQDARAAVDASEYTLGLEILKQAAEIPPPAEALQEIVSLRETAETAVAAREVARRARQQAEDARAQMAQALGTAQGQADVPYAPGLWHEAQAKSTEAEAAFARAAYGEAQRAFDAATAAYRRFQEAACQAQREERDAAERAREQVALGRQRAEAEEAPQYARELWATAEAMFAAAQATFAHSATGRIAGIYDDALAAYGRAEEAAREARQRERQRAEAARGQAAEARERSLAAVAPHRGRELPDAAEAKESMAAPDGKTTRGAREDVGRGSRRPVDDQPERRDTGRRRILWVPGIIFALGGLAAIVIGISYLRSPQIPSPVSTAPQPATSAPSGGAGSAADLQAQRKPAAAEPPGAAATKPPPEQSAGTAARVAGGEVAKTDPDRPVQPLQGRAEERGVASRPAEGRRGADQAGAQMASARLAAERAAAAYYAPKLLATAQAKERDGAEALRRTDFGSAIRLLGEARSSYQAAAEEAKRAADAERQIASLKTTVEQARGTAIARRQQALAVDAGRFAADLLGAAEAKHAEADALAKRENFAAAARAYDEAAEQYAQAALRAKAGPRTK
jgi:predicted Ser/Thr protein kinase